MNPTLTSLKFIDGFIDRQRDEFETLIRSLTSLKCFKCKAISTEGFNILAREVPALKPFEVEHSCILRFPEGDVIANLKGFKVGCFDEGVQVPTGDSNLIVLVRKAMRDA